MGGEAGTLMGLVSQSPSKRRLLSDAPLLRRPELLRLCRLVSGWAMSPDTDPWSTMLASFAACLHHIWTNAICKRKL